MTPTEAGALIRSTTEAWLVDEESDVVWAGEFEGRWGIRLVQRCRDFTTMWFTVGERTVGYEAYLLPEPPHRRDEVFRLCLVRNHRSWPAAISMDRQGDLYVGGRIALAAMSPAALDEAVGAVYETIELSFSQLVSIGFMRREKNL